MTSILRSIRKLLDRYKKLTGYQPRRIDFGGPRIRSTYPQATPPGFPRIPKENAK